MLDWFLRGGAEAQRINRTTTISGIATASETPMKLYPYIGTGIGIALGSTLSLNAGVTATVKDLNDLNKTEYTTTLGIKIGLNN
jgi:hypothetical protein